MFPTRNCPRWFAMLFVSCFLSAGCRKSRPPESETTPVVVTDTSQTPSEDVDSPPAVQPGTSPSLPVLGPEIPFDLIVTVTPPTLDSLQHDFDVMSWNTFVALNWPANADGEPAHDQMIGQDHDNSTVWETWKESYEIFLPNGKVPTPWGTSHAPLPSWPQHWKDLSSQGGKILMQVGKTPGVLDESVEPFKTGPLIDQNGKYARFEILVNKTMFDYIVTNKLYSKQAQQDITKIVFPCGLQKKVDNKNIVEQIGAIMVKAAWKLLDEDEVQSRRFHKTQAIVYTPPSTEPKIEEKCELAWVGLVGLHVVHKTPGSPQWVWSTFEHVNNCPTQGDSPQNRQEKYNFFRKDDLDAKVNTPAPRPWDPNATEPPSRQSQIERQIPITADVQTLNAEFQAAFRKVNKDSVWQHYQLISTQWPTKPSSDCDVQVGSPVDVIGTPAPQFLANSTLESYIQGNVPNVSSSCLECHANATTTNAIFSDFTYLLQRAQ